MEIVKQMFSGREIRVMEQDGAAWVVAADVAAMLGYSSTAAMTRRLPEDEKGVRILHTLGGAQEFVIVSEPGLYRAIVLSRKEEAERFKRWLYHELLPTLRRTGFYSTREAVATPHAIARAYGVATRNIPHYMAHHGILPVGTAENPDTGKMVDLYPVADVQRRFMLGSGPRSELRPYSGPWERLPLAVGA